MSQSEHPPFLGVWTDPAEPEPQAPREPLSRSRIVAAAVRVLDRDGVEGLSMRTLAQELHTAATSLYRHVHNKGELLDLTVDAVMAEVALPPEGTDWRTALRLVAMDLRRVLISHRDAAVLHGSRMAIGPNALSRMEYLCSHPARRRLLRRDAAAAGATIINYTVGSVLGEVMPTSALEASGYTWDQFAEGDGPAGCRAAAGPLPHHAPDAADAPGPPPRPAVRVRPGRASASRASPRGALRPPVSPALSRGGRAPRRVGVDPADHVRAHRKSNNFRGVEVVQGIPA